MPYQLWIEEEDKAVWHRATRLQGTQFVGACGGEMRPRIGRLWPQKAAEPGPLLEQRCHTCVGSEP
jgi:hypothetical protein